MFPVQFLFSSKLVINVKKYRINMQNLLLLNAVVFHLGASERGQIEIRQLAFVSVEENDPLPFRCCNNLDPVTGAVFARVYAGYSVD
jgi:hypothetical protein